MLLFTGALVSGEVLKQKLFHVEIIEMERFLHVFAQYRLFLYSYLLNKSLSIPYKSKVFSCVMRVMRFADGEIYKNWAVGHRCTSH